MSHKPSDSLALAILNAVNIDPGRVSGFTLNCDAGSLPRLSVRYNTFDPVVPVFVREYEVKEVDA